MTNATGQITIDLGAELLERLQGIAAVDGRPLDQIIRQDMDWYASTHKVQNCVHCGEPTTSTFGGDTAMCPEHMTTGDAREHLIAQNPHPFQPYPRKPWRCQQCGFRQRDHEGLISLTAKPGWMRTT